MNKNLHRHIWMFWYQMKLQSLLFQMYIMVLHKSLYIKVCLNFELLAFYPQLYQKIHGQNAQSWISCWCSKTFEGIMILSLLISLHNFLFFWFIWCYVQLTATICQLIVINLSSPRSERSFPARKQLLWRHLIIKHMCLRCKIELSWY